MLYSLHVGVDAKAQDLGIGGSFCRDATVLAEMAADRGFAAECLLAGRASKENISARIGSMVAAACDGDTLFLTFATHGARTENDTVELILLGPTNGVPGRMDDHHLWRLLSPLWEENPRSVTVVLLVDACSSAGFGNPHKIQDFDDDAPKGVRVIVSAIVSGFAWLKQRGWRTGRRSTFSAFTDGDRAPDDVSPVRLHLFSAAPKSRVAASNCIDAQTRHRGCFTAAIQDVAETRNQPCAAVIKGAQDWLASRNRTQVPAYCYYGAATPTDLFPL